MAKTKRTTAEQLAEKRARNALALERLRGKHIRAMEKAISDPGRGVGPSARYNAATRTRLRPGSRSPGGAPTKHLTAWVQSALRRDVQDLKHNSSAARIVMARAAEIIVGDGPVVTSTSAYKAWNALADERFNLFFDALEPDLLGHPDVAERLSGPEQLAGMVGAFCTDGDQLIVHTHNDEGQGTFQIIEGERVRSATGSRAKLPGGSLVDGVEMNRAGAARFYHVADWDVHGNLLAGSTRRIPARDAMLVLNPIGVEAGMVRGAPALQACLDRIERLDSYDESTAVAAEIATRFCAIVESATPNELKDVWEAGTENQPDRDNSNSPKTIEMQAGMLHFLEKGGTVKALDPKFPTTNFRDYVLWHYMILGAELGLPIVAALFDASGLSWSNIKALLSLSMRSVEPSQARMARVARWMRARKITEWMENGELPANDDWHKCEIVMPRAPVVDFKSEVEGYEIAERRNYISKDQITQALGTGRFSDIAAKRAEERALEKRLDIVPVESPGAKAAGEKKTEDDTQPAKGKGGENDD